MARNGRPRSRAAVPATATAAPWQDLSISAARTTEPAGAADTAPLLVTVSRPDASVPITVGYATADGTALTGVDDMDSDDVPTSGTLAFAQGETVKSFTVTLRGDRIDERDVETFTVALSDPDGAGLATPRLTAEIADQDPSVAFPAPGSAATHQPDGDLACDGGFFSLVRISGRYVVQCLGGDRWSPRLAELTGPLAVDEADAATPRTFTLVRADLIAYSTAAMHAVELVDGDDQVLGTATATFNGGQGAADVTLPVPGDDVHTGDRALGLRRRTAARAIVHADGRVTVRLRLRTAVRRALARQPRMTVRIGGAGADRTVPVTLTR